MLTCITFTLLIYYCYSQLVITTYTTNGTCALGNELFSQYTPKTGYCYASPSPNLASGMYTCGTKNTYTFTAYQGKTCNFFEII